MRLTGVSAVLLLAAATSLHAQGLPIPDRLLPGQYDCVIKPSEETHVSTPVPGVLKSVLVDRGDRVKKGDVIAELNASVDEAAVQIARHKAETHAKMDGATARVEFLTRKRARLKGLAARKIISDVTFDELETDLEVAKQNVIDAKDDLEMANLELMRAEAVLAQKKIHSPVSGIVTERKLSPGEYWTEQQYVVTIASVETLHVESFLPIALHRQVSLNDVATIIPEEPIGGRYKAKVKVIDHVYDAASGTFGVRLDLDNSKLDIPAGIRCKIEFGIAAAGRAPFAPTARSVQ